MPIVPLAERGFSPQDRQIEGYIPSGSVVFLDRSPGRRIPKKPQTYPPGSRQALLAAARAKPGEKISIPVRSHTYPNGYAYSDVPGDSSNRAANHASPDSAPIVPLFTPPPLPASESTYYENWESWRAATGPDKKGSEDHSRSTAAAKKALYGYTSPVEGMVAAFAAQASMTGDFEFFGTRAPGAFLENPGAAIDAFRASSPELVQDLYVAHEESAAIRRQDEASGTNRVSLSPEQRLERRDLRIRQAQAIERRNRGRRAKARSYNH